MTTLEIIGLVALIALGAFTLAALIVVSILHWDSIKEMLRPEEEKCPDWADYRAWLDSKV